MSERERRLGLNEAVFREVNERISEVNETFGSSVPSEWSTGELDLICECDDTSCVERISMPVAAYEQVRADPRQFVIVPGHEDHAVEDVVARENTYNVVRKRPGDAAVAAEQTDSRSH